MQIIKTRMSKIGNLESYINTPVISNIISDNPKPIGVVKDVIELDDTFEITVCLWEDKIKFDRSFSQFNDGVSLVSLNLD